MLTEKKGGATNADKRKRTKYKASKTISRGESEQEHLYFLHPVEQDEEQVGGRKRNVKRKVIAGTAASILISKWWRFGSSIHIKQL